MTFYFNIFLQIKVKVPESVKTAKTKFASVYKVIFLSPKNAYSAVYMHDIVMSEYKSSPKSIVKKIQH